jgi:hypothetical protein
MEDFDPIKAWNEALLKKMNEAPPESRKNATEVPNPISLELISASLPPAGQAWLNGLNRFCRRAVEHDLRTAGPDLFVEYWTPCKSSNATSVHPITGCSFGHVHSRPSSSRHAASAAT